MTVTEREQGRTLLRSRSDGSVFQVRRDEAEIEGGFRVWVARAPLASVRYPWRRQICRRNH